MQHVALGKPCLKFLGLSGELLLLLDDALCFLFLLDTSLLSFPLLLVPLSPIESVFFIATHAKVIVTLYLDLLLRLYVIGEDIFFTLCSDNVCIKLNCICNICPVLNGQAHVSFNFLLI